mmetsp:Transcript_34029/g.88479  ORF Transcript_34029/g.88479 Transcript_34029/m.88479 type:complete len:222 (-) Transcript_34029:29-694(-)
MPSGLKGSPPPLSLAPPGDGDFEIKPPFCKLCVASREGPWAPPRSSMQLLATGPGASAQYVSVTSSGLAPSSSPGAATSRSSNPGKSTTAKFKDFDRAWRHGVDKACAAAPAEAAAVAAVVRGRSPGTSSVCRRRERHSRARRCEGGACPCSCPASFRVVCPSLLRRACAFQACTCRWEWHPACHPRLRECFSCLTKSLIKIISGNATRTRWQPNGRKMPN